jgi:N-acetylmuramoyl-L-alanine amidase
MALVDGAIAGGKATATWEQMLTYLRRTNAARAAAKRVAPLLPSEVLEIATAYSRIGENEHMAADGALAQALHETDAWTFGNQVPAAAHNPAGIGATNDGTSYRVFPDWPTGIAMHFYHVQAWAGLSGGSRSIRYKEVQSAAKTKGYARTWRDLGGRWAVPGTGYGEGIERHWQGILAEETTMAKPRIALRAGHHDKSGGNPYEHDTTGLLTPRIAAALRAVGCDVRVITPDEGRGDAAVALDTDAATAVAWARAGWVPDAYLEVHTEGVGDPGVRGVFGIYPDWGGDVDADARDRLIPLLVAKVSKATGFPVRGNGLMSEKATGVGLDGSRLGVFRVTEAIKADCTRLIVEFGAHSNPVEARAQRTEAFLAGASRAVAEAFAEFFGLPVAPTEPVVNREPVPPVPEGGLRVEIPGTGEVYWVIEPVLTYYQAQGGFARFGYPQSGLYTETEGEAKGLNVQYFERARLECQPDGRVTEGRLGSELLALRRKAA